MVFHVSLGKVTYNIHWAPTVSNTVPKTLKEYVTNEVASIHKEFIVAREWCVCNRPQCIESEQCDHDKMYKSLFHRSRVHADSFSARVMLKSAQFLVFLWAVTVGLSSLSLYLGQLSWTLTDSQYLFIKCQREWRQGDKEKGAESDWRTQQSWSRILPFEQDFGRPRGFWQNKNLEARQKGQVGSLQQLWRAHWILSVRCRVHVPALTETRCTSSGKCWHSSIRRRGLWLSPGWRHCESPTPHAWTTMDGSALCIGWKCPVPWMEVPCSMDGSALPHPPHPDAPRSSETLDCNTVSVSWCHQAFYHSDDNCN